MTLSVFVNDASADPDDTDATLIRPAGFETYRKALWGTPAMKSRAPMLSEIANDLYVKPEQFDEFERQCHVIDEAAEEIAAELFTNRRKSFWAFLKRENPNQQIGMAEDIKRYARNFLEAVDFARSKNSHEISIG
ncbi:MAG: hypothetical protein AAF612_12205 [Planctomycetota bacterium]